MTEASCLIITIRHNTIQYNTIVRHHEQVFITACKYDNYKYAGFYKLPANTIHYNYAGFYKLPATILSGAADSCLRKCCKKLDVAVAVN